MREVWVVPGLKVQHSSHVPILLYQTPSPTSGLWLSQGPYRRKISWDSIHWANMCVICDEQAQCQTGRSEQRIWWPCWHGCQVILWVSKSPKTRGKSGRVRGEASLMELWVDRKLETASEKGRGSRREMGVSKYLSPGAEGQELASPPKIYTWETQSEELLGTKE